METHDSRPEYAVQEAEYLRLLGYPAGHQPGDRPRELMAWARDWYGRNGRPWVYLREAPLQIDGSELRLDGMAFHSRRLREHFRRHEVCSTVLVAVSAGRECEEHARSLWQEGRPDEYFFLEMFASAVVEDLVARASGRICALAGHRHLMAVPHYSPGYSGWDVAEQGRLFELITARLGRPLPGPLEVLSSGMLKPKKSLLGVFGLAPVAAASVPVETPCENCAFSPCSYRRAAYRRHSGDTPRPAERTGATASGYRTNTRALKKWAAERVRLHPRDDGTIEAVFRFDGTTCSHQPLAFDYRVRLSGPAGGHRILESDCAPAPDDENHRLTCSYLTAGEAHLREIAADRPLSGRPLDEVLGWVRPAVSTGCHCSADSRAHKWGLALEAIHFALHHHPQPAILS
jgi:hypothetical protein